MFGKPLISLVLVLLPHAAVAAASPDNPPQATPATITIQGSWAGIALVNQLIRQHEADVGARFVRFEPRDSSQVPEALARHECDVGMMLDSLATDVDKDFEARFEAYPIGRLVVHVAVNARSSMHTITLKELRDVFSGKATSWNQIPASGSLGRIELFAPTLASTESSIFRKKAMQGAGFAQALGDRSGDPSRQKLSTAEVIGAVGKQPRSIGFFLQADEQELDRRVRLLRVAKEDRAQAVTPSVAAVSDGSYPLWDTLTLYLHPDAPPAAREFCRFASGEKAVKIVRQFEMWPEHHLEDPRGKRHLAEVRRGSAKAVVVCDLTGSKRLLDDLAVAFMKSKSAVQLGVQVTAEANGSTTALSRDEAEQMLSSGNRELLLVEEKEPSASTKGEATTTRAGDAPASVMVGRMTVGIIVHRNSLLDALPLDELRSILCGEISEWPGAQGSARTIHVYGPYATEPITLLLQQRIGRSSLKYAPLPDHRSVILKVARDPAAIGFVDLSQLSPNVKGVKLLSVYQPSQSKSEKAVSKERSPTADEKPTPAARLSSLAAYGLPEDYPLVRTLTFYVSPYASETTNEFVQFVVSDRGANTLVKHSLLPQFYPGTGRATTVRGKSQRSQQQRQETSNSYLGRKR